MTETLVDVARLLPEIEQIEDEGLRAATADALGRCLALSNWSDPADMPFVLDIPAATFDSVQHVRAVVAASLAVVDSIAESLGLEVDRDRLVAAVLLHDASKWLEYGPGPDGTPGYAEAGRSLPHGMYAACAAQDAGLPAEVVQAIAAHSPQNTWPTSSAIGVVLHHVDLLITDCCRLHVGKEARFKVVRALPPGA